MTYVHRTMVLTAAVTPLAQQLAIGLAGEAAAGMWVTGLAPTADATETHYISAGMIEDTFAAVLTDAAALYAACQAAGAGVSLAQCQALVAGADVSDAPAHEVLDALGLVVTHTSPTAQSTTPTGDSE